MFIGHFGVALAAKNVAPETSLGTLVLAAQFIDLLWPIFHLPALSTSRLFLASRRFLPSISSTIRFAQFADGLRLVCVSRRNLLCFLPLLARRMGYCWRYH